VTRLRVVVLGIPQPLNACRWKDDLCEEAGALGWNVMHLPTKGTSCDTVVQACTGADLLIWARTHGHNPRGDVRGMLRRVEDGGTVTVGLHMDKYWGVPHREAQVGVSPWWSCQYVFTADGGNEARFAARGVTHRWCPPAVAASTLGHGTRDRSRWPAGVVFVGSNIAATHGDHRSQLIAWAGKRYPTFRSYTKGVWGRDLADLYATAKVAIGDSAPGDWYWSDRIPTTLARGGILAHPTRQGLAGQGFTGEVMLLFEPYGFTGLAQQIADLTPARRREMSEAGMDVVERRHLWRHRLTDIERTALT
jgi:hypothetical protein